MHFIAKTPKSLALTFLAALAATAALVGSAAGQHGTPGTTQLISRVSGTGPVSPGLVHQGRVSAGHTVSADGRFVVFESDSDGLSNQDDDTMTNVYVRDLQTGTTTFVSRATGANGAPAHKSSSNAVISADGTHVAFATSAALDPLDTNGEGDVYVRDLTHNTTTLVSRSGGASDAVGNKYSYEPSIDADGNRVAFTSNATNLSAADTNSATDIYIHDVAANNTSLISRASGGGAVGDKGSSEPSISDSGLRVAFTSCADNFDPVDTNASCDVYLRDLGAELVPHRTGLPR